jgi:signal transduction histidine kinase
VVEIKADGERVKGALLNLLDNAVKYSPAGSEVSVSLCIIASERPMAQVTIVDKGGGISVDDLPHIFERFYRGSTDRGETSGSGLGLAIAESVMRLHGGSIKVQSEFGKGSEFTILLPVEPIAKS